jgi:hypothetical protein
MIQTRQRIDYRSGKVAIIRRTSMSYDRLMQVVAEQAMQRADSYRARAVLAPLRTPCKPDAIPMRAPRVLHQLPLTPP